MLKKIFMIALSAALSFSAGSLYAASANDTHGEAGDAHGDGHGDGHGSHYNHVALFAGVTTVTSHGTHHYFTLGADYERYFLDGMLGAGVLIDAAFTDADTVLILGVPLFFHPISGLKVFVAPGIEMVAGHNEMMVRGGIGYDIHIGNYSLTPTFSVDYIPSTDHIAYVYGFAVGRGF